MRALTDRLRKINSRRLTVLLERLASHEKHDGNEALRAPSPWAIAVSVLALLGFGVLVGTTVSPAQGGASALVLGASTVARSANASTSASSTTPPPTKPEATPSAPSSESGGEGSGESSAEGGGEEGTPKSGKGAGAQKKSTKKSTAPSGDGQSKEGAGHGGSHGSTAALPPIKHVFLIVLSEEGYNATFGAGAAAPYLSRTLLSEGELLESDYAVAGGEPANGIALISGQGPTPQTLQGCPLYGDLTPASAGPEGQALGSGCVYPKTTLTIADQLESAGKTWKAYMEGVDTGGPGAASSCLHPQLGASDPGNAASSADGYVTWRNPFVYFHSLIDGPACAKNDIGIGHLATDLAGSSKTPSFAYIAPDACDDGSQMPCTPGAPAGLAPAEAFLHKVVGEIEKSAAYREGALIAITFDHAPQSGPGADSSGCCVSSPYPNLPGAPSDTSAAAGSVSPADGTTTDAGPSSTATTTGSAGAQSATQTGGGKVGLLLISKYVKPGSLNVLGEYDHFSLLLSIEKLFGLKPLGYAGAKGLLPFDSSVYNAYH